MLSVAKIPDIGLRQKSLCSGRILRTLLPREKLLLEHIFDGVAKGRSSCLIRSFNMYLWQSVCVVDMLRQIQQHGSAHSNIYDNTVL